MKRGNLLVAITATIVFVVGIIVFTFVNNDHSECEIILENSIGPNGESISIEEHLCREIFNF